MKTYQIQPATAWLTVNRRCNFRCKWCYAEATGYEPKSEMSLELAEVLAKMAWQIGVRNLLVIGGEPTLWRPLMEFNDFCMREGFQNILITNGARFGGDRFSAIYKGHTNNKIGLSIKASTPQQLYEVAGVTNFDVVKKGIIRAVQELNAQVSITYNTFYVDTLTDVVRFAVECGAKSVKIDFCSTTFSEGRPNAKYMVEPKRLAENIMRDYPELERITEGHIVFEMMVPFCLWPQDFIVDLRRKGQILSVCHVLKRKGIIFDERGNLLICNALFDYPIGRYGSDFCDDKSLLTWLNTERIVSYYDRIGRYPSTACKVCHWYSECGGGCPLRWALYKADEFVRPMSENLPTEKEVIHVD